MTELSRFTHQSATGKGSGVPVELNLSHVYELEKPHGKAKLRSVKACGRDQRSSNRVIPPSTPTYAVSSGPIVTGAKLLLYLSPVPASRR
jgi:hypothetical protein